MPVLTRNEAQTRAQLIEARHYTVDLDLTQGDDTFDSRTVIHFTARTAGDTFLELKPATLRSVTLDGQPLDPDALADNRFPLTGLTPGDHELRIDAAMRYSRTGEGMHRFTDPADGETYVYTQLFLDDASATGQQGAARCRAALPTPEAKAAAWDRLFASDDLSNYLFTATAQGFWQPEQTELVADYVPRYYPQAQALAVRRGPAMAEAAGNHAFPLYEVTPAALALGEEHLASPDLTPALRRKLTDQLDALSRALRVRSTK
ncbi:hypothetical protein SSPIM334S_00241 [Streptomyces spiroverticillatus]